MKLYLVRHGEAKRKEADSDRHLTNEGIQAVKKMAAFLKPLDLHLGSVWHSKKTRARETAELLLPSLKVDEGLIERNDLSPNDSVKPIARELRNMDSDMMIVGHQPFLSCLATVLLFGQEQPEIVSFETAAVACLEQDSDRTWTLRWLLPPDLL
jgi:phosphohistidine phosphatase